MTPLARAIARLESVLAAASHPLGDPAARPHRRSPDEMALEARESLGFDLSGELLELWSWWSMGNALAELPEALRRLDEFELMLPGGIYLRDVEFAQRMSRDTRDSAIVNSPADLRWVPFGSIGDRLTLWCDVSDPAAAQSPVVVAGFVHPTREAIFRLDSIAALIETSAYLMDQGWWIEDEDEYEGWVYEGPRDEFWF